MPTLTPPSSGVNLENVPPELSARLGFRLPEPIVPPPPDQSVGDWPTLDQCRKSPRDESLFQAIRCAQKLLRAYPPGEAPEALEARLEILLNRVYRERRTTKRGKLGAERPALLDMRKGRMKPLPVDEVPSYRIIELLGYVKRTETDFAFLDGMRRVFEVLSFSDCR